MTSGSEVWVPGTPTPAPGSETWVPVCGSGAVLYYNDPITRTWKPVCGAEDPVYGKVNGEWVPLCCGQNVPSPQPECVGLSTVTSPPMSGASADGSGHFTAHFTVPPDMVGEYAVSVIYHFYTPDAPNVWADLGDGSGRIHLTDGTTVIKKLFYAGETLGTTVNFSWTLYSTEYGGSNISYGYMPTSCTSVTFEAVCGAPPIVPPLGWVSGAVRTNVAYSSGIGEWGMMSSLWGGFWCFFDVTAFPTAAQMYPGLDVWGRHAEFDPDVYWAPKSLTLGFSNSGQQQGGGPMGPGTMIGLAKAWDGSLPITADGTQEVGRYHFAPNESFTMVFDFSSITNPYAPAEYSWHLFVYPEGDTPWSVSNYAYNRDYVGGVPFVVAFQEPPVRWVY